MAENRSAVKKEIPDGNVVQVWCLSCLCVWPSARCLKQTKLHGDRGFLNASFPFTLITH